MSETLSPVEVEAYLHRHIPLSAAMDVRVSRCGSDGVTLTAPLAPNINHRATVFGGSISAVAILSAWTWLHFALRQHGLHARLVIQRNQVEYLLPVAGDFEARCSGVPEAALTKFTAQLRRLGKARVRLSAELWQDASRAATFEGDYAAVRLE